MNFLQTVPTGTFEVANGFVESEPGKLLFCNYTDQAVELLDTATEQRTVIMQNAKCSAPVKIGNKIIVYAGFDKHMVLDYQVKTRIENSLEFSPTVIELEKDVVVLVANKGVSIWNMITDCVIARYNLPEDSWFYGFIFDHEY
jgi:hypothetical protein